MNAMPYSAKLMFQKGQIAIGTDTFKLMLVQPGFTFDPASHHAYADVSAYELPTAFGYTAGGVELVGLVHAIVDGEGSAVWANGTWSASGGSLQAGGAFIYDDSTDTAVGDDYTKALIAFIDPGAGQVIMAADGTALVIINPEVRLR